MAYDAYSWIAFVCDERFKAIGGLQQPDSATLLCRWLLGLFLYRSGLNRFEEIASKRRGNLRFDDPLERMSGLEGADFSRDLQARRSFGVFAKVEPAFLRTELLSINVKLER